MHAFVPANFPRRKLALEYARDCCCIRPMFSRGALAEDPRNAFQPKEAAFYPYSIPWYTLCIIAQRQQELTNEKRGTFRRRRTRRSSNADVLLGNGENRAALKNFESDEESVERSNFTLGEGGSRRQTGRRQRFSSRKGSAKAFKRGHAHSPQKGDEILEYEHNRSVKQETGDIADRTFRRRKQRNIHADSFWAIDAYQNISNPAICINSMLDSTGRNSTGDMDHGSESVARKNGLIDVLLNGTEGQTSRALRALATCTVSMSVSDFNEVLCSLCRQRKLRTATGLIHVVESSPFARRIGPLLDTKSYTIMLDVFGKSRQLGRAFDLFYKMQRDGMEPNIVTYNAMISGCARNNEPDLAMDVFREMQASGFQPDKFTYASLIDSRAKSGDIEGAFEIANLMDKADVAKDQTIYCALMEACSRTKQLERALLVYEDMKRRSVWPNLVTFAVLLDCCANVRDPYKAFELFAEIKNWNLEPNVVSYTALIDCCGKSGWPDKAALVFEKMLQDGISPNEITYGALIEAWTSNGRLDQAFFIVKAMTSQTKVLPNTILIGSLLDGCRKLEDGTYISEMWNLILQHNIRLSKGYYPSLIALSADVNDVDTALAIAGHCYARGLFRRSSCHSEDPILKSLAFSMVHLRRVLLRTGDSENFQTRLERLRLIWDSMPMTEAEADSLNADDATIRTNALGQVIYGMDAAPRNMLRSSLAAWKAAKLLQRQDGVAKSTATRSKTQNSGEREMRAATRRSGDGDDPTRA